MKFINVVTVEGFFPLFSFLFFTVDPEQTQSLELLIYCILVYIDLFLAMTTNQNLNFYLNILSW